MPAFGRHVAEGAVSVVVIEDVRDARIVVGMAIRTVAGLLLSAIPIGLEGPVHVARDEQVELSVVVGIEETGARTPAAAAHARARGHVGESAISVVAVQRVAAESGEVQILEAVVVVVADRDAHAVEVL